MRAEAAANGEGDSLVVSVANAVATLRLNRPRVHNALDDDLLAQLESALAAADRDPAVRALVLTGTGPTFSAGDDLKNLRDGSHEDFAVTIRALQRVTAAMVGLSKPIIAALNGPAYGAGLELVLACDMRFATPRFACATPEVRLGLVATNGASLILPLLIGPSRARHLLMSGATREAHWCASVGLVDEIVADEALLPRATTLAAELSSGAPGATAATRALLNVPFADAMKAALDAEAAACIEARASAEADEGVAAFFAKRPPAWTRP
ncbi:enoyl-CoA hydratase/isomerase family protein [Sphingoaurantiacus capsulatus]|uniref:Enoyl-CoA hydratase/isomerase family protein n=1 Tax=Sphingoaurantiacus capsulatus TaxID=1771310 RepID=A0ABV7XEP8_9SPHN